MSGFHSLGLIQPGFKGNAGGIVHHRSRDQLRFNAGTFLVACQKHCPGIDVGLLKFAATLADEITKPEHMREKPPDFSLQVAAEVAALNLDRGSPTKAETILAALFLEVVVANPGLLDTISRRLGAYCAFQRSGRSLGGEPKNKQDARQVVDTVVAILDESARVVRVPRLLMGQAEFDHKQFDYAKRLALGMKMPQVLPLLAARAKCRLDHLDKIRDQKKRSRIVDFARHMYLELSEMIGWNGVLSELQDKIFLHTDPDTRQDIINGVNQRFALSSYAEAEQIRVQIQRSVERHIRQKFDLNVRRAGKADDETGADGFWVEARVKSPFSIYKKLRRYTVATMPDIFALRIVLPDGVNERASIESCNQVLNALAAVATPIFGTRDDYISEQIRPGSTYQSLHGGFVYTTKQQKKIVMEVQVRTFSMHMRNEIGDAAHFLYKGAFTDGAGWARDRVVDLRYALNRLFRGEHAEALSEPPFIYVSGKHGDLHELPAGATVLDFGARIHWDFILARNAVVSGRPVEMHPSPTLRNGDRIDIDVSSLDLVPQRSWCDGVVTRYAREAIRRLCRRLSRQEGRQEIADVESPARSDASPPSSAPTLTVVKP